MTTSGGKYVLLSVANLHFTLLFVVNGKVERRKCTRNSIHGLLIAHSSTVLSRRSDGVDGSEFSKRNEEKASKTGSKQSEV